MCPLCGQASIVKDKSGRVCYRKSCGWREKPMGRIDKPPCWPDVEPSVALLMPRPETPKTPIAGPVCLLPIDAPMLCSHLYALRDNDEQFVREEPLAKPDKEQRKPFKAVDIDERREGIRQLGKTIKYLDMRADAHHKMSMIAEGFGGKPLPVPPELKGWI